MKKLLCAIMILCLNVFPVTSFAKDGMENALSEVKGKIEIPDELSEFESSINTYREKTQYNFTWYNKQHTAELGITSNADGIITGYRYYSEDLYLKTKKQLPAIAKSEAVKKAEDFLKEIIPEAFREDDKLVYDSYYSRLSDNGTRISVSFVRKKDGIEVYGQHANVELLSVNNKEIITSYSASFNPEITYEAEGERIPDSEFVYMNTYPAELVYEKIKYDDDKFSLIYRLKDNKKGFISAYTGEVKELYSESSDIIFKENMSVNDTMASGGSANRKFSEAELKELENTAALITEEEIKTLLKADSDFPYNDKMILESSDYYKENEKYYVQVTFAQYDENNFRIKRLNVTMNAQTKELRWLNYYDYNSQSEKSELSEAEVKKYEDKARRFINKYSLTDAENLREEKNGSDNKNATVNYIRLNNGVAVIGNNISATYDVKTGLLSSYSKNFEELEFELADGIIKEEVIYGKIYENYPLIPTYINTGEEYSLCYTLNADESVKLSAFTGEKVYKDNYSENKSPYIDIENHWCASAAERLKEFNVYLPGEELKPDENITQIDMLRLFASSVYYSSYSNYTPDELYRNLIREGILSEAERTDEAAVLREDSFKYLVNMCGYGEIAKIEDIFKTSFADESEISQEKIGYASILSGLGVINGNGGYVKPKNNLTRAEALMMIYNMLK